MNADQATRTTDKADGKLKSMTQKLARAPAKFNNFTGARASRAPQRRIFFVAFLFVPLPVRLHAIVHARLTTGEAGGKQFLTARTDRFVRILPSAF